MCILVVPSFTVTFKVTIEKPVPISSLNMLETLEKNCKLIKIVNWQIRPKKKNWNSVLTRSSLITAALLTILEILNISSENNNL